MALLPWNFAKYSVNIRAIDQQHQQLFALLNDLYDAVQQGQGKDMVGKLLAKLLDYTLYHFGHEENLFRQHGYTHAASHCAEHVKLTDQLKTLKRQFEAGEADAAPETFMFLQDWLNDHILGLDRKYVDFLAARGVR